MNWSDCKGVTRDGNFRNIYLNGIYNDGNLDQSQFWHGSEEYIRYFDGECGKIDDISLYETQKQAIGFSSSATDPRLIGIRTIHNGSERYTSGFDEEVMRSGNSGNNSDKFTSDFNNITTNASSIEEPDGVNYPKQPTFSVGTLMDKTFYKMVPRYYYTNQIESCSFDTANFDRHDFCSQVVLKSESRFNQLISDPLNVTFVENRERINNETVPCNTGHKNKTMKLSTTISSEINHRFPEENVNLLYSGKDITKNRCDIYTKNNNNNNRRDCNETLTSKISSSFAESISSKLVVGEHGYKGLKRKHDAITPADEEMFTRECVFSQPVAKVNKRIQVICASNEDLKKCTKDCENISRFVNVIKTEAISINKERDNKECAFPLHFALHPKSPDETKHKEEINESQRQSFDTLPSEANHYSTTETPDINNYQMKSCLNNREEKIQNLKELLAQQEKTLEKLRESRLAKKFINNNLSSSWLKNEETDGYHGSSDLESLSKNGAKNVLGVKKSWLKAWREGNNAVNTDLQDKDSSSKELNIRFEGRRY